ncbi:hypothetical protein A7U60_g6190 [Sanghuangporus baumii]|uniref:DUF6533 domain-containing protein n=1 Tax=Sanghuangporus baumii TaxID=108892 RepID=A0A9Q5N758_SANBA|nr:hypothetical protein A7U60_g6190 [Sanghuangporus baumii]
MVDFDTPAGIEHVAKVIKLTKWCNTSSVVMYVYELMITLDEEVNLIWVGDLCIVSFMKTTIQYLTLVAVREAHSMLTTATASISHAGFSPIHHHYFQSARGIISAVCRLLTHLRVIATLAIDHWLTRDYSIGRVWIRFQWIAGSLIGLMAHHVRCQRVIATLAIDHWLTRDYSIGRVWIRFQWIAGSLIGLMAHLTLELRLYAMFNKSKKILVLLVVGTTAVASCMFGLLIEILQEEEGEKHVTPELSAYIDAHHLCLGTVEFINLGEAPELHMCVKTNVPYLVRIFWIPILAGEALLVSLAVYKGLQTQMQLPNQNEWWSERAPYGFLRFLVRDSVLFFLMVSAPFLATELVWVIAGSDYIEVPVGFAIASSSIWSQRLLLNIRKHRQGPVEELHVTVDSDIPEFSNRDIVLETFRSMKTER